MNAKWIRSKQWDDEHIPRWAWPAKFLLRLFSSVWFGIALLVLVGVYGALASIPAGIVALLPTVAFYGLTLLAVVVAVFVPLAVVRFVWRPSERRGRNVRFAITLLGGAALIVVAWEVWYLAVWPRLQYDPATGKGVRFFADFCHRYRATTLRRLPGMEMSELEFYSWWPLRTVLLLFVSNMIVATVRRIEFTFERIGVLMVHSGIVVIALGSAYYSGLKKEGDTILLAGQPDAQGKPGPGQPVGMFYDNTATALWIRQRGGAHAPQWEQRRIQPPRYNDYGLRAAGERTVLGEIGRADASSDGGRTLSLPVEPLAGVRSTLDDDVRLRIVGYASYAEAGQDWIEGTAPTDGSKGGANPVRFARLESAVDENGKTAEKKLGFSFFFMPREAKDRLAETEAFGIEFAAGMDQRRWKDLQANLPAGAQHAIIVEVPATSDRPAYSGVIVFDPARLNEDVRLGESGYSLKVTQHAEQPPFPLVTPGYRNAQSSLAVVRITPPTGASFDRWVYHRFPEISQDLLEEKNDRGMPKRRDADPAIRVSYIDASKIQVYLDERPREAPGASTLAGLAQRTRAIVRTPGGAARTIDHFNADGSADLIPGLRLRLLGAWAHAEPIGVPRVVPEERRSPEFVGTHDRSMLAVEVVARDNYRRVVWVRYSKYMGLDMSEQTRIDLPGGRSLELAFGRLAYELPGFVIQLTDFQMVSYEHTNQPRDYRSVIRVTPTNAGTFEPYEHVTQLNAPLQAPFMWSDDRSWLSNAARTLISRVDPNQFKFSQAGWDAEGWNQTQQMAGAGQLPRAFARFTILGVGNNPGIHIIALGGVMMSVGIPWAFYLKPWLMKRKKRRLQSMLAAREREPELAGAAS